MSQPSLEEQIKQAGIYYPRSYDIAYRAGFVIQSAGAVLFTVLYILRHPFYPFSLIVFEAGIALSSIFVLLWKAAIKKFMLTCLVIGIVLQAVSLFGIPFEDKIFLAGLGFVLVSGAGLTGKEAYCFGYPEGWLLLLLYPIALLPNLFGTGTYKFNLVISVVITVLHISFLRRKLSQPLLKKCEGQCPLPIKKGGQ